MKNLKIRTMVFTIFMTTVLICAGCGSQSSTSADNNGSTNTTKEKDASDLSTVSVHEDIWGNDDSVTRVTYTLDYSDEIWTLEDDNPEDDYFVLSSEEENLRVYMGINGELEQNATKTEEKMSGIDTTCYLFDNGEVCLYMHGGDADAYVLEIEATFLNPRSDDESGTALDNKEFMELMSNMSFAAEDVTEELANSVEEERSNSFTYENDAFALNMPENTGRWIIDKSMSGETWIQLNSEDDFYVSIVFDEGSGDDIARKQAEINLSDGDVIEEVEINGVTWYRKTSDSNNVEYYANQTNGAGYVMVRHDGSLDDEYVELYNEVLTGITVK